MLNKKYFISGVIISAIIYGTIMYAQDIYEEIYVQKNAVKIFVNDEEVQCNNFMFEDKNYIPMRTVSEKLGYPVFWDDTSNTANIYTPSYKLDPLTNEECVLNDIRLKMTVNDVVKLKGKPLEINNGALEKHYPYSESQTIYGYGDYKVVFDQGFVISVVVTGGTISTSRDIKVNDSLGKVFSRYGSSEMNDVWKTVGYIVPYEENSCTTTEISFTINDNKVSEIQLSITGY